MAAHRMTRDDVRDAITRYLARHPDAKDGIRGVIEWCRTIIGATPPEPLVKDALDELEAGGRIVCAKLADGTWIYYARRSR